MVIICQDLDMEAAQECSVIDNCYEYVDVEELQSYGEIDKEIKSQLVKMMHDINSTIKIHFGGGKSPVEMAQNN